MDKNSLAPLGIPVRASSKTETIVSATSNPFLTPAHTSRTSSFLESADTALRPDPGTEAEFQIDGDNPFAFSPGQLGKLLNPKSPAAFRALGGLRGIARGLQTNLDTGINADETSAPTRVTFDEAVNSSSDVGLDPAAPLSSHSGDRYADRARIYGRNVLPTKRATPLWKIMWAAYNDQVLILLTIAAVISLALGLYETLGVSHPPGSPTPVDWVEGVAICVAILVVVLVSSLNDWQKEKAFVRLNAKKEEREIKAIRSGRSTMISVYDIMVGDVLHLEAGDLIPVDGIFIQGYNLKCDESSATGESDALKKTGGNAVLDAILNGEPFDDLDPFIISGGKVLEGKLLFL